MIQLGWDKGNIFLLKLNLSSLIFDKAILCQIKLENYMITLILYYKKIVVLVSIKIKIGDYW